MKMKEMKRQIAVLIMCALLAGILPVGDPAAGKAAAASALAGTTARAGYGLNNPRTDSDGVTTWDCVWFGNYWQEDTNGDGKADKNDAKQPIKWRVLSVDGDDAFLLADKNLECKKYNDGDRGVTWDACTMRSWLNGYRAEANREGKDYGSDNFLANAFSTDEQFAIRITNVANDDNSYWGTEGGNDTSDKLYLLSITEVGNPVYGFSSDYDEYDKGRQAKNTEYAKAQGAWTETAKGYEGNGVWWLRSPGSPNNYASDVNYHGYVFRGGGSVYNDDKVARPTLHLNLSSTSSWSYAGTVTSEGEVEEEATPRPTPSVQPTITPNIPTKQPMVSSSPSPSVSIEPGDGDKRKNFDESIYRASVLYDSEYKNNPDPESMGIQWYFSNMLTPASNIYGEAEKSGLATNAEAWRELQALLGGIDDPSGILDNELSKVDVYEGIIFAIFEAASKNTVFQGKDLIDDTDSLFSIIKNGMKLQCDIEIEKTSNVKFLTTEQKESLRKIVEEYFKSKGIIKSAEVISKIAKGVDHFNTFVEFVNYMNSSMAIMGMSEGYKSVLQDMYDKCSWSTQRELKTALRDCIVNMNLCQEVLILKMCTQGYSIAGREVAKAGVEAIWDEVKMVVTKSNPYVGFLWLSYKGTTFFCDKVLGTSDIAERTIKLGAMMDVRRLLQSAFKQERDDFVNSPTRENADRFLAAVDVNFNYLREDCKTACQFLDTVSSALASKIQALFKKDNTPEIISQIKRIQSGCDEYYDNLNIAWLYQLEVDYPEQYDNYKHLEEEFDKKYHVACPVDVYVYDESGQLAASVENNVPWCKDESEFTVIASGDEKEIWLYGDSGQYTLEYVATDEGTMDITVEEYDDDCNVSRKVQHVDIPLKKGTTYTSKEDMASDGNSYELTETKSGENRKAVIDTLDKNIPRYTLTVRNGYMADCGFTGSFYAGEKVTVYANVPDGALWNGWSSSVTDCVTSDKSLQTVTITMPSKDMVLTGVYTEASSPAPAETPKASINVVGTDNAVGVSSANTNQNTGAVNKKTSKNVKGIQIPKIKSVKNIAGGKVEIVIKEKRSGASGYQLCYSTSKKWKNRKLKLTRKTKLTVKKLKKKKTYYFRVRAYQMIDGRKVYSKWSSSKKIKIKK